jgi:hypothetical protein
MHPIQDLFLESFSYVLQFDLHFICTPMRTKFYSCKKWVLQEVSCASGRSMKTTMETMAGTLMTESTATMAPPATIVLETTTATAAVVMMMEMSVRFLQSSTASSQAPTGGRLASMYQANRLALVVIGPSLVMTPSFFYE